MLCPVCNEGSLQEALVETCKRRGDRWVVFVNVPALVCEVCGEQSFSQEIAERLADMLDPNSCERPTSFIYTAVFDLVKIDVARTQGERPLIVSGTDRIAAEFARLEYEMTPPRVEEETNTVTIYSVQSYG
jgi:YgiT-type zinc finger domain-containing protein